ncbi:MAG: CoA-binding protein [Desulforhopalus sp.]|nr:CoA-binding protein [Desulforhopalus sp.]
MQTLSSLQQSPEIVQLLKMASTIAVVGLSPKENRPSNMVGRYLVEAGYTIFPVNPGQSEILGEKCYPDLKSLPYPVDIVDIFRKSEEILPIVKEIISLPALPKGIWMQQGIRNDEAAELARSKGIVVVMDRCIKVEHERLRH